MLVSSTVAVNRRSVVPCIVFVSAAFCQAHLAAKIIFAIAILLTVNQKKL
jgi:hypothetical protein